MQQHSMRVARVEPFGLRDAPATNALLSMEVDVNRTVKTAIAGAFGALVGVAGLSITVDAQQSPGATTTAPPATQAQPSTAPTTSQATPAAPGSAMSPGMMQGHGMGGEMMNMGQKMRSMGQQMMGGHATAQQQQQMGRQMMDMGKQMESMGQQMPADQGNRQTPMQGHR